jgi:hypothetical protein
MSGNFHFTYASDWRNVPGAFWVHRPVDGEPGTFAPPAPLAVPHKGFPVLHVEFEKYELLFSSVAQLEHYIEVLSQTVLPTSRCLSEASGLKTGPNQHWLSRLPGELKSPKSRQSLVKVLGAAKVFAAANSSNHAFNPDALKRAG